MDEPVRVTLPDDVTDPEGALDFAVEVEPVVDEAVPEDADTADEVAPEDPDTVDEVAPEDTDPEDDGDTDEVGLNTVVKPYINLIRCMSLSR